jgi:hypothetical protein
LLHPNMSIQFLVVLRGRLPVVAQGGQAQGLAPTIDTLLKSNRAAILQISRNSSQFIRRLLSVIPNECEESFRCSGYADPKFDSIAQKEGFLPESTLSLVEGVEMTIPQE